MLYPLNPLNNPLKSDEVAIITRARETKVLTSIGRTRLVVVRHREKYIYTVTWAYRSTPRTPSFGCRLPARVMAHGINAHHRRPRRDDGFQEKKFRRGVASAPALPIKGGVGCHSEKNTLIVTRCCHHRPSPLSNYYMNYGNGSPKQARRGVFRFGLINSPSLTREPLI